jgi:hypothetical protein
MAPAGEAEVADLTVAGGSHYVSYGGIVSSNCGFDELTHFEEDQYRYLFSRLRSSETSPVPPRMRSASNPGGKGHVWVKRRFIDKDGDGSKRIFIPARLADNPGLDQDEYLAALSQLDSQTVAQLRDGDWNARGSGEWVYDQEGIDAAESLGRLLDGNPPEPAGGSIELGIDWGESTHALTIWPLERGGVYVTDELPLSKEEPGVSAAKMLRMADATGWPVSQSNYDAAGVQSQRTFIAAARRTHPDLRTMKIPFSKYKVETINYLRRLFERTAAGETTQVIAISPRCSVLLEQLRGLHWKDADAQKVEKGDDHGPDALIAGVAPIAARSRS